MAWFRKRRDEPTGPDYSSVNSRDKAAQLAAAGELVRILLLPVIFGGEDRDENVVFVPPFAAELKQRTDANIVKPLATDGKISRYSAQPIYSGDSFIPVALEIRAYDPSEFNQRIAIWGEGLK